MSDHAGHPVPLVLLLGPEAPTGASRLATALGRCGTVVVPDLATTGARPADLSAPALAVVAAITAADASAAVLCGIGLGAMVALQVAAADPRRAAALVLCTAARPTATTVRSLHYGVAGALPARTLQVLAGGRRHALAALDQVRPCDYRPLVARVSAPTLVLYGEHDPVNVRPSRRLARTLPVATAAAVTDAGPDWMWSTPERFADAAASFVARHTR